jgi:peptidoglycan glycosyltransferase
VNKQITRIAVVGVALLGSLIVGTTYWQTWAAPGLADRADNQIQRVAQFRVDRGNISTGQVVLARNRQRDVAGKDLYFRRYPQRGLLAHVHGYSTQVRSRAGLERSMNDYLTASNQNLGTVVDRLKDEVTGATIEGNHLALTVDVRAQRTAMNALGRRCGSVVALEPKTGRVLVMASSPTYDPNLIETAYGRISRIRADCRSPSPLLNRATYALYVPGSTFKVVTAAAALESGKWNLESTFSDPGYCIEYGKRVYNYDTSGGYGTVNFLQSLQYSINSVFCNIGKELGVDALIETMRRFGFYSVPPLETPVNERKASGLYDKGELYVPPDQFAVDPGRMAFGQERLLVTPLQMAMVVATVANDGVLMRPHVVDRILRPSGSTLTRTKPEDLGRAVSPETASALQRMMTAAVANGTGTAAQIPGVEVAGKTGTAETGREGANTTSFVAFAPVDDPQVAIAVFLENQSGTGGTTAAPVAKEVMQALLRDAAK